ncbi:MAG: DUF6390 family protein [Patescibacteria group bacterium]
MFTLKTACRYSVIPHNLGLCGPKKNCSIILLGKNKNKIKEKLKEFPAVYYYCREIAKQLKIKDPLDDRVLEVYWLGGVHNYHVWKKQPFNKAIKMTNRMREVCEVSVKKIGANYYTYHWEKKIQRINIKQAKNLNYINKCLKNQN